MGCFFGGLLARAGEDVAFIARGRQLAALTERDLTIHSALVGDSTMRVNATADAASVGIADVLLFCVKTYDVASAASAARPLVGPDTVVLTMQNGVETADLLSRVFDHRVVCGISWVTANLESPGVLTHARGTRLVLGEPTGGVTRRIQVLHEMFVRSGIQSEPHSAVNTPLWEKFMAVCPAGGLSAVTRLPFGALVDTPAVAALARGVIGEVAAVARARGVSLPEESAVGAYAALERLAAESPLAYPSLYHDLAAGRRLEIDALNGAVDRLGAERGVPTPLNFAIYASLAPYRDGPPRPGPRD
jgi:2-dehydropantoate 2-reductase